MRILGFLLATVLLSAPPAAAGWLDETFVLKTPSEEGVRLPIAWPFSFGGFRPYLVAAPDLAGGFQPERDLLSLPREPSLVDGNPIDMGFGMSWKVLKRLELFSEYRFLQVNPDRAFHSTHWAPEWARPELRFGISIRLF